jgi:putative acyl-CoA dehydrogenase
MAALATHEVANQAPPLVDFDAYATDRALVDASQREGAGWAADRLHAIGRVAGSGDTREKARLANAHEPTLKTHDRYGNRVNFVEYHPAWHDLMKLGVEHQLHSLPWAEPQPGVHVARGAAFYLMTQAEAGIGCPISATFSVVPAMRKQPDVAAEWEPRILSSGYDVRDIPATEKRGALSGMGMTEKQGGSDVRANTTTAAPVNGGGPGGEYRLTGHKWFFSIPMCDVFLVLAQAPGGISCFLFPRWTPDDERNGFRIMRLKDKLGNRSNASSEVEFDGAWARLVGEEGAGVRTIIEMVNHTRLDCALGSAAGMRAALVERMAKADQACE